jgi:alkyl sulfatase BDS1-like metallo-beta-lactamase superfamily hydrolase
MDVQKQVDRLIDERGGRELLFPDYDETAYPINDFIYRSAGTTAAYMIATDAGRVIVNTGMGWEAPHHKRVFDAVCPGPTPYILTTQGHVDHVGGVAQFREKDTRYVAQANNRQCQADDKRLVRFRGGTALLWFPRLPEQIRDFGKRYEGLSKGQDEPTPDITFEDRMQLSVGGLEIELIHLPGGETIDSCIVWLPQHRIALISNLFGPLFPHFPNFNTLRGDKYRFPVPYMANVDRVRALKPKLLVTGRHTAIEGEELIDACLARMRGAVESVHQQTLDGMNAGKDLYTIMDGVEIPAEHRVGQGYGKAQWAARTIWESYTGWFQRRSTAELYASNPDDATTALARIAGKGKVVAEARRSLDAGDAPLAIRIAEAALVDAPKDSEAIRIMIDAHEQLLGGGGDESFWESGWLRHELARWQSELGNLGGQ